MYLPSHFESSDAADSHRIIGDYPLGTLVTHHDTLGLDAHALPFEFEADQGQMGVLNAHVARANPVWQIHSSGTPVLVVFQGAHGYISPNSYPSKHQTHRQVPTWNYEVVHAHGVMTFVEDERFLRGLVARLTRHHEASEPKPWRMGDAPSDYIQTMLSQIVGIQIQLTQLICKRKLSQNKDTQDRLGAAQALDRRGQTELARLMRDL